MMMDVSKAHEDFSRRQQELDVLRRQREIQTREFSEYIKKYKREMNDNQERCSAHQ